MQMPLKSRKLHDFDGQDLNNLATNWNKDYFMPVLISSITTVAKRNNENGKSYEKILT